ncbi:MAG: cyclic pyranopterin monophosphate synthase MoaC [Thermodesulfovibrionales bacterium]|nr:cyclic pyranopterin monophosphate synthase MoaC [Thermodesulfovibrionales bacterium]
MKRLTHIGRSGRAKMADVSGKPDTLREAWASGSVSMKKATLDLISTGSVPKGDVFSAARIAGIMAAKRTPELIPLCHPINITSVEVDLKIDRKGKGVVINSRVKSTGPTGVEMEALVAVAASALTVYDMCKAVDKDMVIGDIVLREKTGGRSGPYRRPSTTLKSA